MEVGGGEDMGTIVMAAVKTVERLANPLPADPAGDTPAHAALRAVLSRRGVLSSFLNRALLGLERHMVHQSEFLESPPPLSWSFTYKSIS